MIPADLEDSKSRRKALRKLNSYFSLLSLKIKEEMWDENNKIIIIYFLSPHARRKEININSFSLISKHSSEYRPIKKSDV